MAPSLVCCGGAIVALLFVCFNLFPPADCFYDRQKFKKIVTKDTTNDDAIHLTATQLIERSGFGYEEYYSTADDGYITHIVRIINPKADRAKLKQPPVLVTHGAHVDMTSYLSASSIQHHPEAWPRTHSDGSMTSSNRSLAFMLANQGFDVFLIGSRGSNKQCQAYTAKPKLAQADGLSFRPTDTMFEFANRSHRYWEYGLDDIIEHDLKRQIDLVSQVTQSRDFFYFTFSLSTPTTMVFLNQNPDYAARVRGYVQMGPAVVASHRDIFSKIFWEKLVPHLPTRGKGFLPTFFTEDAGLKIVLFLSRSMKARYTVVRAFLQLLFGPSPKYQTNLELNLLAHIYQPVSFKSVQQYGQNSQKKRLTKFNYGKFGNYAKYGQLATPNYQVKRIEVQNWLLIGGTNDRLANPDTVERLKRRVQSPRPVESIQVKDFNHLDLIGALEVDKYVNLPVAEYLNKLAD